MAGNPFSHFSSISPGSFFSQAAIQLLAEFQWQPGNLSISCHNLIPGNPGLVFLNFSCPHSIHPGWTLAVQPPKYIQL
jgi:hypothetical protein